MKNSPMLQLLSLMIASLLFFTGCAAFGGNQLPTVNDFTQLPANYNKPTASYSFSGGYDVFSKGEFSGDGLKRLEDEFVSVFEESGYFASLGPGDQGQIHLEIRYLDSGTPAAIIPAIFTGLSLYAIPSWATDDLTVTAKIKDIDGNMRSYALEDSVTLVQWLPMIFVAPFKTPAGETIKVRKNIYRNLLIKMKEDGLLPEAKLTDKQPVH